MPKGVSCKRVDLVQLRALWPLPLRGKEIARRLNCRQDVMHRAAAKIGLEYRTAKRRQTWSR